MKSLEPLTPRYRNGTRRWRCVIQIESMFGLRVHHAPASPHARLFISDPRTKKQPGREPLPNHAAPKSPPRSPAPLLFPQAKETSTEPDAGHDTTRQVLDALPMRRHDGYTHTSRSHVCALATPSRMNTTRGVWHVFATQKCQSRTPVLRR
jgi:hypothetical protein